MNDSSAVRIFFPPCVVFRKTTFYVYMLPDAMTTRSTVHSSLFKALFLTLWLAAGPHVAAGQSGNVLTPLLVSQIHAVGSVSVAPDGRFIAFTRVVPRDPLKENGPAWVELHVIDVQTREQRPYVTGSVNVSRIDWTPDGSGISFLSRRPGDERTSLYVIPVGGGEAKRVLSFDASISSYDWCPSGKSVLFLAEEAAPRNAEALPYEPEVYEEGLRNTHVWIAEPGGEEKPKKLPLDGSVTQAVWHPSKNQIAVTLAPTSLIDDFYMYQRVRVVDAATGRVLSAVENSGKLGRIEWSPDGSHIAMLSGADINDPSDGRLLVAPASGGKPVELSPGLEGDFMDFAWVDEEKIAFIGARGVQTVYGHIGRDGESMETVITEDGPVLTSFSVTGGGDLVAFTAETPEHPSEVYLLGKGRRAPERLTVSNGWLSDIRLAPQEAVTFKARDGLELEGVLIRPLDAVAGRRYPLILVVHGGPEAHDTNGWLTNYADLGQVAAARGFAVFYPNYRGSTGRGVTFSKLSQGDPAGKEFDDLVDAVDHLIGIGLVDRSKVGVTGGSYGGYATAWLSTRYTDRFAAGVMFVGISNKISKVGTTDIPDEEYLVHARKRPWENWTFFLERSPIYYAAQSRTPLLILHGKEDPRVNVGQSHELYRHLKLHGNAPVRLVLYPGEGHGNRNSTARLDYMVRSLEWFEHYLQGAGDSAPAARIDREDVRSSGVRP